MRRRIGVAAVAALAGATVFALASDAFVTTPYGGWSWGSPRPQGHTLSAIGAGGAGTYAVGEFGTILRSDDGGASWSALQTNVDVDFTLLAPLEGSAGFLAAGRCTLLHSADGGGTLRQRRLPCGSPIAAISLATTATGYVVRRDGRVLQLAAPSLGSVERTRLPAGSGRPNDMACTGATTCFVATGVELVRTTDAGQTWKQVSARDGVRSLFFVDKSHGYAVGDGVALKTTDGGASWTALPSPGRNLREVSCGDELHCVVVARNHVVLFTADGFATLEPSKRNDGRPGPVLENTVAFTSATHVAAAGKNGYTWTSDDGGLGFDKGYISPFFAAGIGTGGGPVAYAFGRKGFVARTTDGGRTWQRRTRAPAADWAGWWLPELIGIVAIDRKGYLFRSSDGAASWKALGKASPAKPRALWSSPDGKRMMVGGPFGLLRSSDGSATFKETWPDPVTAIEAAGDYVFLIGPRAILRTDDGGASFTELGVPGRITDVAFPTASLGFAATRDGRLWRTENAGGRWREVLGIGAAAGAVIGGFRANDDGSIEGSVAARDFGGTGRGLGWILHTSDGGATWRPQLVGDDPVRDLESGGRRGRMIALLGPNYLFWTATGGDAGKGSALSIRANSAPSGRFRVVGRLSPNHGKQKVVVAWRPGKSKRWHVTAVLTSKKGTYHWTPPRDGGRFKVVAHWLGTRSYRGAGSKVLVWHPPG